jgi:uncharacterized protein (DUF433 family)/DNA-binding transcriptional MerR regulator
VAEVYNLIGRGLYSLRETRRLTKIPRPTLNRWVKGYARRRAGERVNYDALLQPSLPILDEQITLSFRDLIELRFIDRLRQLKVSWAEIKATIDAAKSMLETDYPFGTRRFATDGRRLFSEIQDRPDLLLHLRTNQITADRVFSPDLYSEIEFEKDDAARWRPAAGRSKVVLDPGRSFGKPILDEFGIPTALIKSAFDAEESIDRVADWFEIPGDAVQAAVDFEIKLAA